MPEHVQGTLTIDYAESGHGPTVMLLHSSVSGNRQWRSLTPELDPHFRVVAPNLFGYGTTTPWEASRPQRLDDHVAIVRALCDRAGGPVHLVGHSFGGSVALAAARALDDAVDRVVLLEPNPFAVLAQQGRLEAYEEAASLYGDVKRLGGAGEWMALAARFADYFVGDGAWEQMPDARRAAFAAALPPNFHEWDSVIDEATTLAEWGAAAADVLVVRFGGTRRALSEIHDLCRQECPHWTFADIDAGGHMAPLSNPAMVDPLVVEFLRRD